MVCGPSAAVRVSNVARQAPEVMGDPKFCPSTWNCSVVNPAESAAASIVTVPETFELWLGDNRERPGSMLTAKTVGVLSAQPTLNPTTSAVVLDVMWGNRITTAVARPMPVERWNLGVAACGVNSPVEKKIARTVQTM